MIDPVSEKLLRVLAGLPADDLSGLPLDHLCQHSTLSRTTIWRRLKELKALELVDYWRPYAGRGQVYAFKVRDRGWAVLRGGFYVS